MAFTGNFLCTSFKVEILGATHNFTATNVARSANVADVFKIALYTNSASFTAATTAYTATNEVAPGAPYTAGGASLTISSAPNSAQGSGGGGGSTTLTTAWLDFADTVWSAITMTARGAMIYNSSQSNKSVAILDFGADKTSTAGDFTIQYPAPNNLEAIIRIA